MSEDPTNSSSAPLLQAPEKSRTRIGNLDFDRSSHCVYHLIVHVVFCVKFRRRLITAELRDFIHCNLRQLAEDVNCEIIEFEGEEDHVRFSLRYPPTVELSRIVVGLRRRSTEALLEKYGSFFWGRCSRNFWNSNSLLCSVGGGAPEIFKAYVETQPKVPVFT
jgi:putative transposase